jgi:hypothetical protein
MTIVVQSVDFVFVEPLITDLQLGAEGAAWVHDIRAAS